MKSHLHRIALAAVLGAGSLAAQPAPAPGAPASLQDALTQGKVSLSVRLRYEYVDQDNALDNASALTLRTRLGYTTAAWQGFQARIEAQNTTALVDDYQEPGATPNGRSVVADPEVTEVSQVWLSYTSADIDTSGTVGRQRIVFDNARFIGDVGWRHNHQTFDSVSLKNSSVEKLDLSYAYLWKVKRIFADPNGAAFTDFDSNSHLFNAAYTGLPRLGKLTAYAYLLDLENAAGNGLSSATYGLSLAGSKPLGDDFKLGYRLEYATQSDYADNPAGYRADYYVAELTLGYKGYSLKAGHEVLGSDGGAAAFQTPLATLHAFNGWSDQFLATPGTGLRDTYIALTAPIPGGITATVAYHNFEADDGGADYGDEFDFMAAYKYNRNLSFTAKASFYNADTFGVDTSKFSLQADYAF